MVRFMLLVAVALMLVQTVPARVAADIIQYESLDLAVVRSDLVLRGQVTEIVSQKGENGTIWNRLTVQVTETIKGEKLKEVSFLVREGPFSFRDARWRNLQDEMFFCLNALKNPEGPFRVDYSLRGGWMFWGFPLTGAPGTRLPVYSIQFKPLTTGKDILAAARAATEAPPGKANALLEWIVQDHETLMPHAVLYPDSERVRTAAQNRQIELLPQR